MLPAWHRAKLGAGRLGLIVVLIKFLGLRAMSLKGVIATRMFFMFGREWSNKSMSSQPRNGIDAEVLIFSLIGDGDSNHGFPLFGQHRGLFKCFYAKGYVRVGAGDPLLWYIDANSTPVLIWFR